MKSEGEVSGRLGALTKRMVARCFGAPAVFLAPSVRLPTPNTRAWQAPGVLAVVLFVFFFLNCRCGLLAAPGSVVLAVYWQL